MSSDTSDDSLPDWVAEHASPWLQSQAIQASDSSPESERTGNTQPSDHDTHKTQLSSHEQRPEGPLRDDAGFEITQEEAAVRTSLVAALDLPGQTPMLLPEKLSASRCLVEVVDSAATDLAGDAGAVGRFGVVKQGQQQQAQLDLKGAIYGLTVVPCASTLCVVNIRQTEAKVEAVLSEFVQLGQEARQSNDQDDNAMILFGDDDEIYQEDSLPSFAPTQSEALGKKAGPKKRASQPNKKPLQNTSGKKRPSTSGVSKKSAQRKASRGG